MNGKRALMLRDEGYSFKQIAKLMALEDGRPHAYSRVSIYKAIRKYKEKVQDGGRVAESAGSVPDIGRPRG